MCPFHGGAVLNSACMDKLSEQRCSQFCSALQVLPQLLNHLDIEADAPDAPDWGAIAVYTCSANCGLAQPGYLEEFAWVQAS